MFTTEEERFRNPYCPCWKNLFPQRLCRECLDLLAEAFYARNIFFEKEGLRIIAMSRYSTAMKNFIYQCKSNPFNALYPPQLSLLRELSAYWAPELRAYEVEAVVVVPGHPLRSRWQSDLAWFLGTALARDLGFKGVEAFLKRKLFVGKRFYRMQKNSSRAERLGAVQKQFFVSTQQLQKRRTWPRRLLLVDDVCTSGATLQVCAERLRMSGFQVDLSLVLSKVELGAP